MVSVFMEKAINILHICNAYQTNSLYQELFGRIQRIGGKQQVIAPGYNKNGRDQIEGVIVYYYLRKERGLRRLLWKCKVNNILKFTLAHVDVRSIDLIHAHTLFSDGAVAYRIWCEMSKPYCVAVRNTDINLYFKYFLCYRQLGYRILESASKIFLISYSNKQALLDLLPQKIRDRIETKIIIVPNGINDYWLQNRRIHKNNLLSFNEGVNIVYAGDLSRNKNIHSVIMALDMLHKNGHNVKFAVIGRKDNDNSHYLNKLCRMQNRFSFFYIKEKMDKFKLLYAYRASDIFVMPSFTETFGLVYIEALSQGLPIIYSINQGVDGMYREGMVGYHVNPNNPRDIAEKILRIVDNYGTLVDNINRLDLTFFDWDIIAGNYFKFYFDL